MLQECDSKQRCWEAAPASAPKGLFYTPNIQKNSVVSNSGLKKIDLCVNRAQQLRAWLNVRLQI